MLESGHLKIQGTPEDLRSFDGDHLDFLDGAVPPINGLVVKSPGSDSNGKYSAIGKA